MSPGRIIFWTSSLFLILLQPLLYFSVGLHPDESHYMLLGKSMLNGYVPYVDYADVKPPGIWFFLALIFRIFGDSISTARIVLYIANAVSAVIIYLIGKKIWNDTAGKISCILYLTGMLIPTFKGFYVLTDPFINLLLLLAVFVLISFKNNSFSLIVLGLLIAIATLFKQTAALFLVIIFLLHFIYTRAYYNDGKRHLIGFARDSLLILCGFTIPLIITVGYLWNAGVFNEFLYYTVVKLKGFSPSLFIPNLILEFQAFAIVWILSVTSLIFISYKFFKGNSGYDTLVALWLLLSISPLLSRQFGHYFIQILPPASLLASSMIVNIYPKLKQVKKELQNRDLVSVFAFTCAVTLTFYSLFINAYSIYTTLRDDIYSKHEMQTIADYIQTHSTTEDKLLVFPYQPSIYLMSNRDPAVTFLVFDRNFIDDYAEGHMLKQITTSNPAFIVVEKSVYGESLKDYPLINEYVTGNYTKEQSIGRFDILGNNRIRTNN